MFYAPNLIATEKHGLAMIWLAATVGPKSRIKHLSKRDVEHINLAQTCHYLQTTSQPLALRLLSNLMVGVSRIYQQQVSYYVSDVTIVCSTMRRQLQLGNSDELVTMAQTTASTDAITLPDDPCALATLDALPLTLDPEQEAKYFNLNALPLKQSAPNHGKYLLKVDTSPYSDNTASCDVSLSLPSAGSPFDQDPLMNDDEPPLTFDEAFPPLEIHEPVITNSKIKPQIGSNGIAALIPEATLQSQLEQVMTQQHQHRTDALKRLAVVTMEYGHPMSQIASFSYHCGQKRSWASLGSNSGSDSLHDDSPAYLRDDYAFSDGSINLEPEVPLLAEPEEARAGLELNDSFEGERPIPPWSGSTNNALAATRRRPTISSMDIDFHFESLSRPASLLSTLGRTRVYNSARSLTYLDLGALT
ncbi:R8 protein [Dimargaris verticillata]|uniref:R8 protein n=1 Tax=Dimargaris verticillata TaxID=2761393 RepID=A0A9W8EBU1_9FUNG|nr:R8 protein [Dimargaris verticillata]